MSHGDLKEENHKVIKIDLSKRPLTISKKRVNIGLNNYDQGQLPANHGQGQLQIRSLKGDAYIAIGLHYGLIDSPKYLFSLNS